MKLVREPLLPLNSLLGIHSHPELGSGSISPKRFLRTELVLAVEALVEVTASGRVFKRFKTPPRWQADSDEYRGKP